MNISSRILIGFEGLDDPVAVLDGNELRFSESTTLTTDDLIIESFGENVISTIENKKQNSAIFEACITPSNIQDGAIDPALVLDPASDPIPVSKGGTGASNFDEWKIIEGASGENRASGIGFSNNELTIGKLVVGTTEFAPVVDHFTGKQNLAATISGGPTIDLINPGSTKPILTSFSATPELYQITIEGTADPNIPTNTMHVLFIPSPSDIPTVAQIFYSGDSIAARFVDGKARVTKTGLQNYTTYDIYAVAKNHRDAYSDVSSIQSTTVT